MKQKKHWGIFNEDRTPKASIEKSEKNRIEIFL